MNFIFDLDETLVKGDIIKAASEILLNEDPECLDKIYTGEDVSTFQLKNVPTILRDKVMELFSDVRYAVYEKKPIKGAYYLLAGLEKLGHQTGILTSRPMNLYNPTITHLTLYFPFIKFKLGIHFSNKIDIVNVDAMPKKKNILGLIRPDFYFDDNPDYCISSNELGIRTFLISNSYTGWNKNVEIKGVKRLKRVGDFDIFEETKKWDTNQEPTG